jgi:hypothetical protein
MTGDDVRYNRTKETAGKEIFEIQPVILGGSPTDLDNKVVLSREQHVAAVRFWNRILKERRKTGD